MGFLDGFDAFNPFTPNSHTLARKQREEENALRLNALRRQDAAAAMEEENLLRRQGMANFATSPSLEAAYPEMIAQGQQRNALDQADPAAALGRLESKLYPGTDDIVMGKPGEVPINKRTGLPVGEAIPGGGPEFKPTNMQIPGTNEVALARTQLDYDALAEAGYVESGTSVPGLPAPADKKSIPNDYMEDPNNPGRRVMVPGGSAASSRAAELAKPVLDERKLYNASANQYSTMADLIYDDTGASDISLIFGFFKAADPESSVREGEFATVGEKMGLPSKLIGEIKSVSSGRGFLSPKARQDLVDAAGRAVKQRKKSLQRSYKDASGGIDALGVDRKAFIPFNVSDVNIEEVRKEFPDAKEDTAGRVYVMRNGKRAYVELDE